LKPSNVDNWHAGFSAGEQSEKFAIGDALDTSAAITAQALERLEKQQPVIDAVLQYLTDHDHDLDETPNDSWVIAAARAYRIWETQRFQ
jgi:hypothetical protein